MTPDVAVVGGGIIGCSLAAFLAEAGARVVLYEREALAAGASGRNSGVLQDPLDPALTALYEESLTHYADLDGFVLPAEPAGLLIAGEGPPPHGVESTWHEDLHAIEPALAPGLPGYRVDTGRPVPPAAAAQAFARRALNAGAELRIAAASLAVEDGRATGVIVDGRLEPAGAVAVAAGPWTPDVVGGSWAPISALWGVVAELELEHPPTHVIEEAGIDALTSADGAPPSLFSIVTAQGLSAVGSTFLDERPDAQALVPLLIERGAQFVPALGRTTPRGVRACARPRSRDGRPLLGPLGDVEGLQIASGHGAWGVTLGPASARVVADALLGRDPEIAPELHAGRFGPRGY